MRKPHEHRPDILAKLDAELAKPSLYREAVTALTRAGFEISPDYLNSDISLAHSYEASIEAAWKVVYLDPHAHWALYELAEKLVDFEDYFRRWRFNHVTTVERVIGFKRGSGGTDGVSYLKRMLDVELFPELWRVRTDL